ncbi:MAG: SH3 domain-containing protein [Lachnospiraceae bacterium]|nr:SH3 domain-containing protein [Lachnospiraceae bacterium]
MKRHPLHILKGIFFIAIFLMMQQAIFAAEATEHKDYESTFKGTLAIEDQVKPNNLITKPYKVIVTQTTIRTGPGTSYASDGVIYKGDIVHVRSINNGWAKIRVNSKWRYVNASHIQKLN